MAEEQPVCVCACSTYDPTVLAFQSGAGAGDSAAGAALAGGRVAGAAVQSGAGAVCTRRCCATGQCGARTHTLIH